MLTQMASNPAADWTIEDVKTLCTQVGLVFTKPSDGSHYKVSSEHIPMGLQTVPFARPIKVHYIRSLIAMSRVHMRVAATKLEG